MRKLFLLLCVTLVLFTGCFGKPSEDKAANDLKSPDPVVRIQAANKLAELATPEAVRILILHKEDSDYRVKEAIKKALAKIDKRTFLN
ncbi:MAG: HEAT repeat domain-containing protein [Candidatus Riflebacteria bacterium]|nr:HEAT repeat domain-containing protein [Candidatus Riflebacteria bacterium]